ncbi:MAG: hypothetical protein WAM70_13570 [Pyrinomonadaceae bacterium]
MNKKCPNCGFINFVYAEACHKCETVLSETTVRSAYDYPATYRGGVNAPSQPYPTKGGFSVLERIGLRGVGIIVLAIVGALVLGTIVRQRKVKWIEYRPDDLDFTVMMPSKPTRMEPVLTPLPNGHMSNHTFVTGVPGQGTAMLVYVDYTGAVIESDRISEALDATMEEFLTVTKSTLVAKKSISYQAMRGLEFEVSPPAEGSSKVSRGYGKIFFNSNSSRLFIFSITANEGSDLLAGKDKFLNPQIQKPGPARKPVDPPNITLVPLH